MSKVTTYIIARLKKNARIIKILAGTSKATNYKRMQITSVSSAAENVSDIELLPWNCK